MISNYQKLSSTAAAIVVKTGDLFSFVTVPKEILEFEKTRAIIMIDSGLKLESGADDFVFVYLQRVPH